MQRFYSVLKLAFATGTLSVLMAALSLNQARAAWQPAKGPLATKWAKDVKPSKALPEYPRPQMAREKWENLNGLWDYAIVDRAAAQPAQWDGQILVPFCVESALSGVMKPLTEKQRLWYHRTFKVPGGWKGQRVMLHFGAVDWEATVTVNGKELGTHKGGFDGFSFDITDALKPSGEQEIVVVVWDPSDRGPQAKGKQVLRPGGIMYTATSGIWQTVWLEPVNQNHIRAVTITPDVDGGTARVVVDVANSSAACWIEAEVRESGVVQSRQTGKADEPIVLRIKHPKLWSPESPFLYDLKLTLKAQDGAMLDGLSSYFGMRKIDIATAPDGYQRIRLNNQFVFQLGFLDQGFWPDGLYTAPTDEALRFDIEAVRKLGCNMVRKHVKIEPQRWYYWCDKLGLLVWQDMVSGKNSETGRRLYEHELQLMIEQHFNHPSIVMWVNFNEGWGQFDTPRIYELVKKLDPTRLVNASSGGKSANSCGEVADMHHYPGPAAPVAGPRPSRQVAVLGEFGGLGLIAKDHVWAKLNQDKLRGNAAYRDQRTDRPRIVETPYGTGWEIPLNLDKDRMMRDWRQWDEETFIREYGGLLDFVPQLCMEKGLAAAVYTQLTDVENELNGLLTYDRIYKADPARFAPIHQHCLRQQLESLDTGK